MLALEKNTAIYYFIGIGGIGMSALANYLHHFGYHVIGSDKELFQKTVIKLINLGLSIYDELQALSFLPNNKKIIFIRTNTVLDSHFIIQYALKNNFSVLYRSELLQKILLNKRVIGITGSHGKTTTTALIGSIFKDSKRDPSVFIGGIVPAFDSNLVIGNSEFAIVESDDAYKSFLDIHPESAVVTNISYEHLETYKNWDDIYSTFAQFASRSSYLAINTDSLLMVDWAKRYDLEYTSYGLESSTALFKAINIEINSKGSSYHLTYKNKKIEEINIPVPGIPIIKNSLAAIIIGLHYEISLDIIKDSLKKFQGIERRMQLVGYFKMKVPVIDDYGHHPVEIMYVLDTLLKITKGRIIIFFQPHKYSRTSLLWDDFLNVFEKSEYDHLFVTDVFDAGDQLIEGFTSDVLVKELNKLKKSASFIPIKKSFDFFEREILNKYPDINKDDCIVCLGAGKLDQLASYLVKK